MNTNLRIVNDELRPAVPNNSVFYAGFNCETVMPLKFNLAEMRESWWITGQSGSGKTSLWLAPLASYLIGTEEALVIFDLAGQPELVWRCRYLAEQRGRKVKVMHVDLAYETCFMDVFNLIDPTNYDALKRASYLVDAMQLSSEHDHGRQYYWFSCFTFALQLIVESHREMVPVTFKTLRERLQRKGIKGRDADNIINMLQVLALFEQFDVTNATHSDQIVTLDELNDGTILYVFCPTEGAAINAYFATIIWHAVIAHRMAAAHAGKKLRHLHGIVDEFFYCAANNLGVTLTQSRKWGCTWHLANQHRSQLETISPTLLKVCQNSLLRQMHFTPRDEDEVRYIQGFSSDVWVDVPGWTPTGMTIKRQLMPKVTKNQLIQCAATPLHAVYLNAAKRGFEEPTIVQLAPHDISEAMFDYLRSKELPKKPPTLTTTPVKRKVERDDVYRKWEGRLNDLLKVKQQQEKRWL